MGAVSVEPLIYRLVCTNGMIAKDYSQKRYHIGRAASAEESYELYADETIKASERAFLLKIRDTVRAAVDLAKFSQVVEQMRLSQKEAGDRRQEAALQSVGACTQLDKAAQTALNLVSNLQINLLPSAFCLLPRPKGLVRNAKSKAIPSPRSM